MKFLVSIFLMGVSPAFADGFICDGVSTGTHFQMYNHTSQNTRTAERMIVSDPKISAANTEIATFRDVKKTLTNKGSRYFAKVDLRVLESNRSGELIAGTKLGQLSAIQVKVDFNYYYDTPSYNGEKFEGVVNYLKRNGEKLSEKIECTRFLKN